MNWDDLRYFKVLAQTLHLADAANELASSEATVLRRVRALEEALNTQLFVRRSSGHELTAAGRALAPYAGRIESMMGDLERNVAGGESDLAGTVRVVTTEVGAEAILLPALPAFVERYPGLVVEIDVHPDTQDLLRPEPTLALRFQRPERGDFTIRRLGTTRYRLYASDEFVDAREIDPAKPIPNHLPYIGWASPLRDIKIARWLLRALPKGQPVARLSSLRAHVDSAKAGIGVANLPDLMAAQVPGLVALTAPLEPVALSAWLVVPKQFRKSARVVAVANFVEGAFRSAQRLGV